MNENQFCLSRNRYAIFTGNLIIHQIFSFGAQLLLTKHVLRREPGLCSVLPLAAPPLGKHSVGMESTLHACQNQTTILAEKHGAGWGWVWFFFFLF